MARGRLVAWGQRFIGMRRRGGGGRAQGEAASTRRHTASRVVAKTIIGAAICRKSCGHCSYRCNRTEKEACAALSQSRRGRARAPRTRLMGRQMRVPLVHVSHPPTKARQERKTFAFRRKYCTRSKCGAARSVEWQRESSNTSSITSSHQVSPIIPRRSDRSTPPGLATSHKQPRYPLPTHVHRPGVLYVERTRPSFSRSTLSLSDRR